MSIAALLEHDDVQITAVGTAEAALAGDRRRGASTASIVDLGLPDMPGAELIERIRRTAGGARSADRRLHRPGPQPGRRGRGSSSIASTVIVKDMESAEQLLRRDGAVPAPRRSPACRRTSRSSSSASDDAPLDGRKVLIVDDDVRNIFSLTSVLEQHGMEVVYAENGREGIELLQRDAGHRRAC